MRRETNLQSYFAYNAFDCLATFELWEIFDKLLTPAYRRVYRFERNLVAPLLVMTRRGILIDQSKRQAQIDDLVARVASLEALLKELLAPYFDKPFNYNSHVQIKQLFYDLLAIPPIFGKNKKTPTTDRSALERISSQYVRGRIFADILIRIKDLAKTCATLETKLDPDGRWRASFNAAGTETGRLSSSANPFGTGSNLQNITKKLREIFIADPGYVLFQLDLQGAEARGVAYLSADEEYIKAVESADCHTLVASMVWGIPNVRTAAEEKYYRDFSFRDIAKKGQHGSNYFGSPKSMAINMKVPIKEAESFQQKYFARFTAIPEWHASVIHTIQTEGRIVTPTGRIRQFWGRPWDQSTWREAIAHTPQSLIGDYEDIGIYKMWLTLEPHVQLLAQVHDAVVFQIKREEVDKYLPLVLECFNIPIVINGRTMTIPCDPEYGLNWRPVSDKNPLGLRAYKGTIDL